MCAMFSRSFFVGSSMQRLNFSLLSFFFPMPCPERQTYKKISFLFSSMGNVLITGAAGFIGANLARALAKEHDVHVLLRSTSHAWRIADILSRLKVVKAD